MQGVEGGSPVQSDSTHSLPFFPPYPSVRKQRTNTCACRWEGTCLLRPLLLEVRQSECLLHQWQRCWKVSSADTKRGRIADEEILTRRS